MSSTKWPRLFALLLFIIGVGILAIGITIPILVDNMIDKGLDSLWISPGHHDTWGETPGKIGAKVVRGFKVFNVTNYDEIFQGAKPIIVESPIETFQEYSSFINWNFLNQDEQVLGQGKSGAYIEYGNQLNLIPIPSNGTHIDSNTTFVGVNLPLYASFYALTHEPFPFYTQPILYDVVIAFQNDLYDMILGYSMWYRYFNDTKSVEYYMLNTGFTQANIDVLLTDPNYGWTGWKQMRTWIRAAFEYNSTQKFTDGAFEILDNYFQIDNLELLIIQNSLLWGTIEEILDDMVTRYGTNQRQELACMQWGSGMLTSNLPLDLGSVPLDGVPFPSFLSLNKTFSFIPEIGFVNTNVNFNSVADKLLQVYYTYPMKNYYSMLNLNNVGYFFAAVAAGNYSQVSNSFGISVPQVGILAKYLQYITTLPIEYKNQLIPTDGYSMELSRWSNNILIEKTVSLRNDAFWAPPARSLYCEYFRLNVSCYTIMRTGANSTTASIICGDSTVGWNYILTQTWKNLMSWIKAAVKPAGSDDYNFLLAKTQLSSASLSRILVAWFSEQSQIIFNKISKNYQCSTSVCRFDDMFYLQFGSSGITNNPTPDLLKCGIKPSLTMKDWLPERYSAPIEWTYYSDIELPVPIAKEIFNYETFLNPSTIKLFYNSYFKGNITATAIEFDLPSIELVDEMYNYLIKIIPGFSFFTPRQYSEWIYGTLDPFLTYVQQTDIYHGGYPLVLPFYSLCSNTTDLPSFPKHQMLTGKGDTSQTRTYTKYYGSSIMNQFGRKYDANSSTTYSFGYSNIWNADMQIQGTDGGQFGTRVKEDDELVAFISPILRDISLSYRWKEKFNGLEVYLFTLNQTLVQTSATVPENANYNQFENGFNGFFNISSQFAAPVFVTFPHCFGCEPDAQNMVEYYSFTSNSSLGPRIYPYATHDSPYAKVEPSTGAAVSVALNFEIQVAFYKDYFFKNIHEPAPGKGLYIPAYQLIRSSNLSDSQVDKLFGTLLMARYLRQLVFYVGVTVGACFIIISMFLASYLYRKKKFGGWRSPKETMLALSPRATQQAISPRATQQAFSTRATLPAKEPSQD